MKRFIICVCLYCVVFIGSSISFAQDKKDIGPGKAAEPGTVQENFTPGKVEKLSIVQVPPIVLKPEEEALLNALDAARQAGDTETARKLQAKVDALYGITTGSAAPAERDIPHSQMVVATDAAEMKTSEKWAGDVRINSNNADEYREPSMISTPNGNLYAAMQNMAGGDIHIYRSTDGGQNWALWTYFSNGDNTLRHPSLAYGDTGTTKWLYLTHELTTASAKSIEVIRMNVDNTSVYNVATVHAGLPTTYSIYPEICTDYPDYTSGHYVYLTYSVSGSDYNPVMFNRSTDFGATWYTTPTNITGGSENSIWPTRPDIAYGTSNNDVFVVFERPAWTGSIWETRVWVTQLINIGGNTWETPVSLASTYSGKEYHPRVSAARGNNSVLVAYTRDHENSGDLDIHYAYTTDGGTIWTKGGTIATSSASDENGVELSRSDSLGNFHVAFTRTPEHDVRYTQRPTSFATGWTTAVTLNEGASASEAYLKPAVCANPTKPADQEAGIAWTDYRVRWYDVYFDAGYTTPNSYLLWTK